jgi:hypothetical protein
MKVFAIFSSKRRIKVQNEVKENFDVMCGQVYNEVIKMI